MRWLALVLGSSFLIDHLSLFGVRQVYDHAREREPRAARFVTPLFYRIVRHPLMLGLLLAFWAAPDMSVVVSRD